jgi:hypothetical protein
MEEADLMNPDATQDSELQSLPTQESIIESTSSLFIPEEVKDNETIDIKAIITSCLKDAKQNNTRYSIKSLSQLVAVSEYIDLCACYKAKNGCKRPCLSASMAIARRMGKGPYFARQIQHNELYLLRHRQLPPPKMFIQHGHHTLLDNKSVMHNVHTYLVSQALGAVTPWTFCQHVNHVILPALGIEATITELTAQRWLRLKLGYKCKEARKGIYMDGHERPDVVKEREEFIKQIFDKFEPYIGCVYCSEHQMSDYRMLIKSDGIL